MLLHFESHTSPRFLFASTRDARLLHRRAKRQAKKLDVDAPAFRKPYITKIPFGHTETGVWQPSMAGVKDFGIFANKMDKNASARARHFRLMQRRAKRQAKNQHADASVFENTCISNIPTVVDVNPTIEGGLMDVPINDQTNLSSARAAQDLSSEAPESTPNSRKPRRPTTSRKC
ncbi:OLC1v1012834C1 [Oldenlandia corymbosa var. corymbosa]|uniref:OLC1v1012834C1 n=1 Tax=Oldenlandia corymbosa var. corymbosa TaxID=529605 RepID=A0AAV1DZ96_OLDCO|nr:OLC1v1012834C1 [Oldenlandia corymbosa var. corymbosa]